MMKNKVNFTKVRTFGVTPTDKWINLVKKWNSCALQPDSPYSRQRMLFTKVEAEELIQQYPALLDAIKLSNEITFEQMAALEYGEYNFEFILSPDCPKPEIIGGFKLLDQIINNNEHEEEE